MKIELNPIGTVQARRGFAVKLEEAYVPGLRGLAGFSHVMIVWYADRAPAWAPALLQIDKPYRLAPDALGVFATRSPVRPNGVCVSVAAVSSIDEQKGIIELFWTDAGHGTPVLDIKPYHPCSERVREAKLPDWCATWPAFYEDSAEFPWDQELLTSARDS